jgi:hypothetical protein
MALQRVRRFRALPLRQTSQPHPTAGTPTLVPVPSKINCPRMSVVKSSLDKRISMRQAMVSPA